MKKPVPKLKPLSPLQGQKQLAALDRLFDNSPPEAMTVKTYNAAKKRIYEAMALWTK